MSSENIDRLIFGCGRLSGGFDRKQSIRLLNEAYDLGIRKFDLAPSYGDGQVESILVDALGARIREVQITTKVGLGRPVVSPVKSAFRSLVRPIATSALRAINKKPAKIVVSNSVGNMDVNFLRKSFEDSLSKLKVEKIDALLLHEPRKDLVSIDVVNFLENLKERKLINNFGTGTGQDASSIVNIGDIIQFKYTNKEDIKKIPNNKKIRIHGIFRYSSGTSENMSLKNIMEENDELCILFSTRQILNLKTIVKSTL
jgi:aryl-alcohol dehydrogenase-like predicted oxidoreductase